MDKRSTFTRVFILQCILISLLVGGATWGSISNSDYSFILQALPFFTMFITSAFMTYYLGKRGLAEAPSIHFISFKNAGLFLKETNKC